MKMRKLLILGLLFVAGFCATGQAVVRTDKKPEFFVPKSGSVKSLENVNTVKNRASGTMEHVSGNKQVSSHENIFSLGGSNSKHKIKVKFKPAPVDRILAKQDFGMMRNFIFGGNNGIKEYEQSIIHAYSMTVKDLDLILQNEYETINQETRRMRKIQKHFNTMPEAYRYANFMLPAQISDEMTGVRREFSERKKQYEDFIKKTPKSKKVFIIIAKHPLFMTMNGGNVMVIPGYKGPADGVTFVSLFNNEYEHIFTYMRKHSNMLENRGIDAVSTTNGKVNQIYQNLFNAYIYDLRRIGAGLDVTNQVLLRQISEMTDDYVTM